MSILVIDGKRYYRLPRPIHPLDQPIIVRVDGILYKGIEDVLCVPCCGPTKYVQMGFSADHTPRYVQTFIQKSKKTRTEGMIQCGCDHSNKARVAYHAKKDKMFEAYEKAMQTYRASEEPIQAAFKARRERLKAEREGRGALGGSGPRSVIQTSGHGGAMQEAMRSSGLIRNTRSGKPGIAYYRTNASGARVLATVVPFKAKK